MQIWVIWCKANPKDIATQAFRTYGRCIFDGKLTKPKQMDDITKNPREANMLPGPEVGGNGET
jgi:hypothetical protein